MAKISGSLIPLEVDGTTMGLDRICMTLRLRKANAVEGADLIFALMTGPLLRIGFGGYRTCNGRRV